MWLRRLRCLLSSGAKTPEPWFRILLDKLTDLYTYRSYMFSLYCPLWAETMWWAYPSSTKLLIQAAVHCVPKYCSTHNATRWIYRVQLIACYPVNIISLMSHNSNVREVHFKVRSRNLSDTFGENNLIAFRMGIKKYFCLPLYYTHSYTLYFVTYIF